MAKKQRKATGTTPSGQWHGQPRPKGGKKKIDLADVIPVDPTRATVPIKGMKAGKRKT